MAEISMHKSNTVNDIGGNRCPKQPAAGELPVMELGQMDPGCNFKDFTGTDDDKQVLNLYNLTRPSTVLFELKSQGQTIGGGTGVMVKDDSGSCKILTDNHVVSDATRKKHNIDEIKAVTADGTAYDITLHKAKPEKDLAVVSIKPKSDDICHPIEFVDSEKQFQPGDKAITFGQPYSSGSVYVSEGTYSSSLTRLDASRQLRAEKPPADDDGSRKLDRFNMRAIRGYSGGAVYAPGQNPEKAVGVVDMADDMSTMLMTPVTAAEVKDLTD